jgi:hypothetical protein
MPQYVLIATHEADRCPASSARLRAAVEKAMMEDLPRASQELGVEFAVGPLHLDPGHTTIAVLNAGNIEAVSKLAFESGLTQWNTVQVYPATPVPELMANTAHIQPIFD